MHSGGWPRADRRLAWLELAAIATTIVTLKGASQPTSNSRCLGVGVWRCYSLAPASVGSVSTFSCSVWRVVCHHGDAEANNSRIKAIDDWVRK